MSLALLHLKARSIIRKFDEIEDELALLHADIIFITETWLSSNLACIVYTVIMLSIAAEATKLVVAPLYTLETTFQPYIF